MERIGSRTAVLLQVNAGNDPAKYGFSLLVPFPSMGCPVVQSAGGWDDGVAPCG